MRRMVAGCMAVLVTACAGTSNPADLDDPGGPSADLPGHRDLVRDDGDLPGPEDIPGDEAAQEVDAGSADAGFQDGTIRDPGNQDVDAASWCGTWAEAWCGFQVRCGWRASAAAGACREELADECPGALLATVRDQGGVGFDGGAARDCLEALSSLACGEWWTAFREGRDPFPACREVLRGLRGFEGPCSFPFECPSGGWCDLSACPGTCRAFAEVGGACGIDRPCDPLKALCREGVCVVLPGIEEACPEGVCAWPLRCDGGTCRSPVGPGEACLVAAGDCLAGMVCRGQEPGSGRCGPPAGPQEPCFRTVECADPEGRTPLVCMSGRCIEAPGPGEPCPDLACSGAWCDLGGEVPLCKALPGDQETCLDGLRCAEGLWCRQGRCTPRLGDGSPCDGPWQCESGRCVAGTCRSPGALPCP
ncbi:hypothetical protein KBD49_06200 [Myxococcota bacterium]|nr:hypothetical protein [Myxococcota bacterium]